MSPNKGVGESTKNLNLMFLKTSHCHLKCNVHKDNFCIWRYVMNLGNKNVMTEVILCLPRWLSSGLSDSQDPRQFEPSSVQPKRVGFLISQIFRLIEVYLFTVFLEQDLRIIKGVLQHHICSKPKANLVGWWYLKRKWCKTAGKIFVTDLSRSPMSECWEICYILSR